MACSEVWGFGMKWPGRVAFAVAFGFGLSAGPGLSHPGGLNAQGCHNNRKTGDYHCHQKATDRSAPLQAVGSGSAGYFPNCASARAVGAAPIRAGEAGYSRKLDRDGDGVACE